MYQVLLTAQAKNELKEIKRFYKGALQAALEEIREDPLASKSLTRELAGRFSYKVGAYRIIYKVNKRDKIVFIITAGHRSTVYR